MNDMHSDGWSWGFFGHGFGLVFWIVVIVVIVALVIGINARGSGGGARPSARELLKERYAKGEIDRDEYERKMNDLDR